MKRPVYSTFNIIYQIIMLWVLLFANTWVNDTVVQNNLVCKTLALVFEAALLIFFIYGINQAILSDTEDKASRNSIANRTAKRHMIVTLCFIIVLMAASFKD